jgi:hypothetical protein
MRRRGTWVPTLAAPIVVLVHIASEALATGHSLLSVAWEPAHLVLLGIAAAASPLWFCAAGRRRLAHAMAGFIAISLLVEGNQLGAGALLCALLISLLVGALAGFAIQRAADIAPVRYRRSEQFFRIAMRRAVRSGPYYAFVPSHGSRPPPSR